MIYDHWVVRKEKKHLIILRIVTHYCADVLNINYNGVRRIPKCQYQIDLNFKIQEMEYILYNTSSEMYITAFSKNQILKG